MASFLSGRRLIPSLRARAAFGHRGLSQLIDVMTDHPQNNVPQHIAEKIGRNLHLQKGHPLCTIRERIEHYWAKRHAKIDGPDFLFVKDLPPVVEIQRNFDDLLIPPGHISRRPSDTYYIDDTKVLRTHTSAHQSTLISNGTNAFLCSGDVYRRDEIDRSHYPVFHQMEGVRIFDEGVNPEEVERDLKEGLEGMARELFGDVEMRWVDAYFPFTEPSMELEVFYENDWLEVLGSGVVHKDIMKNCGRGAHPGWAFGLGLERLAMVLFSIPDIRLFWSTDERFLNQFPQDGEIVKFQPYSKFPPCYKDVSFWLPEGAIVAEVEEGSPQPEGIDRPGAVVFHPNDLYEVIRAVAGDLVEEISLIDDFTHPKKQRRSQCYRITFRHMDRNLTNEEVDVVQEAVRSKLSHDLKVELR